MIIGEFSRLTGISAYTLRYYEKKDCFMWSVMVPEGGITGKLMWNG